MTGAGGWPPLLELRQYAMRPGRRDELIARFEAALVEPQERVGMRVCGSFRDLDDPDRFVWLRGFPRADARARGDALAAFYHGPAWARHREAANATMLDSDDVLLLAPVTGGEPFGGVDAHPGLGADPPESVFDLELWPLREPPDRALREWVAAELRPVLGRLAAVPVAVFGSSGVANTFPALPVREGEPVLACLTRFEDETAHAGYLRRVAADGRLTGGWSALAQRLRGQPQRLRLAPTGRSRLR